MIWTLKVELMLGAYAKEKWEGIIEIESSSTLKDLHFAIQDAVNFENDHLYEFYVSRTERSRTRLRFDDENSNMYDTTLESLFPLEKGRKLYYLFDYGDNWLFKITKTRKKPKDPKTGTKYPRLLSETGKAPEQYPVWDE